MGLATDPPDEKNEGPHREGGAQGYIYVDSHRNLSQLRIKLQIDSQFCDSIFAACVQAWRGRKPLQMWVAGLVEVGETQKTNHLENLFSFYVIPGDPFASASYRHAAQHQRRNAIGIGSKRDN